MKRTLSDMKCPLCHKPLTSTEYSKAHLELEDKIKEKYDKNVKEQTESLKKEILDLKNRHTLEEKKRDSLHQKEIDNLEKTLEVGYKKQTEILKQTYDKMINDSKKQTEDLKQTYDKMATKNKKEFSMLEKRLKNDYEKTIKEKNKELKSIERELKSDHKKELAERSKQIKDLIKEQESAKKQIRKNVKEEFEIKEGRLTANLKEKDIQIKRINDELEALKISKTQSELKGEVGELDLFAKLTEAFRDDFVRRQKRGTSSADIIQQIRISTGSLDTPIVYDNKSASSVTKKDIDKAIKYKKTHATNYVIIVSSKLPKISVPNGLYGEKNGILLVHPSIIIEVVKQIRNGIIDISKLSNSKQDQQSKQYKLYEYIISNEFSMLMESFFRVNEDMFNLQAKEERDHETMWKTRKSLHSQLQKAANSLSSGIESITQKEAIL